MADIWNPDFKTAPPPPHSFITTYRVTRANGGPPRPRNAGFHSVTMNLTGDVVKTRAVNYCRGPDVRVKRAPPEGDRDSESRFRSSHYRTITRELFLNRAGESGRWIIRLFFNTRGNAPVRPRINVSHIYFFFFVKLIANRSLPPPRVRYALVRRYRLYSLVYDNLNEGFFFFFLSSHIVPLSAAHSVFERPPRPNSSYETRRVLRDDCVATHMSYYHRRRYLFKSIPRIRIVF